MATLIAHLTVFILGLFIDLTPFIPLSLKGEGEEILERGFASLKHPYNGMLFW